MTFLYWKCGASKFSSISNMTRCKTFNTKCDAFFFKSRRGVFFSGGKLTWWKLLESKPLFSRKHEKSKICHSHREKEQNVIFCMQASLKSDMSKKTQIKSWCVVKYLTQNLTRCIYFISKADAMSFSSVQNLICSEIVISKADQTKKVIFKIWCVVKFQVQNLMRFFPWIQNLKRCVFLFSKSDMSEYYKSKSNALSFL